MTRTHTLVVGSDRAADVLLAGPAVRALAAGADELTLLCGPGGERAARMLPGVDRVRALAAPWSDQGTPPTGEDVDRFVAAVRAIGPDQAVILTSVHRSPLPTALVLRMAGVHRIAGISRDQAASLLNVCHGVPDDMHEVERALSLAQAFGCPLPDGDSGRLAVLRPDDTPMPFDEPYVVVHPGASATARVWPAEHHRELVRLLTARGMPVVVTGSPAERDLTRRVAGGPSDFVADLGGRTTLARLADVLAGAAAMVVADTAPAHLAAAVGTPVVSLFAPTVPPSRRRPYRVPHRLLMSEVPCVGCRGGECLDSGHRGLADLTPAQALEALDGLLRETGARVPQRQEASGPAVAVPSFADSRF